MPLTDWIDKVFHTHLTRHNGVGSGNSDNSDTGNSLTQQQVNRIKMDVSLGANDPYFKTLAASSTMTANAKKILSDMNIEGITNPLTQAGILAVISKESNFIPVRENLNYTSAALQKVFAIPASQADGLAALTGTDKQAAIANLVYMPPHNTQLGNVSGGDGYFFRGWSWNQLTGRAIIIKYTKRIGVDVIANPELMNDIDVMTKATLEYFKDGNQALTKINITLPLNALDSSNKVSPYAGTTVLRSLYYNNPTGDINGYTSELDAAAAMYNINAGAGQSYAFLMKDVTGGRALTMARATGFVSWINSQRSV